MAQQQNLFPPESDQDPADPNSDRLTPIVTVAPRTAPQRRTLWLDRTELLVRVIVRLYLGLLIIALPWMRFWTENGLFSYVPGSTLLASSGFLRGLVSGLGLLNVGMAFQELFFPNRQP